MTSLQLLALAAGAVLLVHAHAAEPAKAATALTPVPIPDLFRPAVFSGAQLSPSGAYLGAIVADEKDSRHLLMLDLAGDGAPSGLRGNHGLNISSFRWVGEDRIVFNVSKDQLYAYGLYAATREKLQRHIPINAFDVTRIIGQPRARPGNLLVWIVRSAEDRGDDGGLVEVDSRQAINRAGRGFAPDAAHVKRYTRPKQGIVTGWQTDFDGELALCRTYFEGRTRWHRYLAKTGEWQELPIDTRTTDVVRMDPDGEHLWVVDHDASVGYRLRPYQIGSGALGEPVATDPLYKLSTAWLRFSHKTRRLAGYSLEQRRLHNVWFHEPFISVQAAIDAKYPDRDNRLIDLNEAETRFLFLGTSDRQPGAYALIDLTAKSLQPVTLTAPWLRDAPLIPTQPISYKTRDGVKLEGYLTLPPGAHDQNRVPLVVLAHGGPWVRDTWTFDPEVQFLASRGYAVLQPNYRGSAGYSPRITGEDDYNFRRMHDDVTDATRAMLRSGVIDETRVAIMGGSFGGYLALAGVAFEKDLYCCAVSNCGVFDWAALIRSKKHDGRPAEYQRLQDRLGKPGKEQERFEQISPMAHVDDITAPVFIAHGKDDNVVDVGQSKKLASALKKRGVPHETFFRRFEGHGFYSYENRVEFYQALEKFLARHLAAPAGTAASP